MNERHGMMGTQEYSCWKELKRRCLNKNSVAYDRYGGRGITICQRWVNSFPDFLSDMGLKPSRKHSIDRIDNDGNYEPSNCRWATSTQQAQNKRVYKTSTTGTSGVTKQCGKWMARITVNKNRLNLGSFDTIHEAISVRKNAELRLW